MRHRIDFISLRWRVIRRGPNDERVFGLIAGLTAAAGVIAVAALTRAGDLDPGWLAVAISFFGVAWLLGPVLLPGVAPILDPQWFRTLPRPPVRIAREMSASEEMSVGTVITTTALLSFVVVAAPHGPGVIAVAVLAVGAQMLLLVWLGRCASALVARLLRSAWGVRTAIFQMSAVLALSFAGWVPLFAVVLPNLGDGDVTIHTPPTAAVVPESLVTTLLTLPTGWGLVAVNAAMSGAAPAAIAAPLVGTLACALLLRRAWIELTAQTLRQPPRTARSGISVRERRRVLVEWPDSATGAVVAREVKTWFRDPHRRLGLGHAWLTPVLMVVLVAPSGWAWALPFIGVVAAAIAAMAAVNTYALDGTALWQILTTPGALRADIIGRQVTWMLLFGLPVTAGTIALSIASRSQFGPLAVGMTLAATGAGCATAPLLSALMPAIGADARNRVASSDNAGNPAGAQWTIFTAVAIAATIPLIPAGLTVAAPSSAAHLAFGAIVGSLTLLLALPLTRAYVERRGPALLAAMAAGDPTRHSAGQRRAPSVLSWRDSAQQGSRSHLT